MMRRLAPLLAVLAAPVAAAPTAPADMASGTEVRRIVAEMAETMRDGRGFLYRPLVRDGETVAALEYWKAPGRPAVHPDEAEYAIVIEGAGTLVSGGTMADAKTTQPGLVEGSRIDGGTTRTLGPGDVLLVPAGVPHWFGITGGKLVLLGMKLPRRGG
ncbi:cupin domain-containing protein [Sphingomonas sp. KR1UV-12]|uniref:Cupin domain-containing protein n=1 Tax=Sphingomonas aurea TaxID=3063994 RepID=A0ABT9EKD9_9SPHN|nr:cupin domain-containing protein [Sphingomonas sp. KR1UV-12]MDP1027320.1 cupin domain-containing protein [Sphingomonas sp. KR1UV-12]